MTTVGLTSCSTFLCEAARTFFKDLYGNPEMHLNEQLHRDLPWIPALWFSIHGHLTIFTEPSEIGPYPRILELKSNDVRHFPRPIAIYAVCPDDMIAKPAQRSDMNRLQDHGFGLVTIDPNGLAHRIFHATPLIQVISQADFKQEIHGLNGKIRQRVSEAFDDYRNNPVNGVKFLSEVIEGLVKQAGNDAVRKAYLSKNKLGDGVAEALDALHQASQCMDARAGIGGVRSYISEYRNLVHHWPRNAKKAYDKYATCRHAFLDGIKKVKRFRTAIKQVGLSGNLPRG